jgi:aldose 1-epimerase
MSIDRHPFGQTRDGHAVDLFVMRSKHNLIAKVITYGGRLTELHSPDRDGFSGNIVLGYDRLEPYLDDKAYIGTLVGRVANRIAGARFNLDGVDYHLPATHGNNTLHGGLIGFDKVVWRAEPRDSSDSPSLSLHHTSPDGQDGFPGLLDCTVVYSLTDDALRIDYTATCDKPTPINLTHHAYFNLKGPGTGDVLGHELMLAASAYTPVDDELIPTGEIRPVDGTPFDFRSPTSIGSRIEQTGGGYDHNFVLDTRQDVSRPAARLSEPTTGRALQVFTTEPGMQFYSGNFLDGSLNGIGGVYHKHGALCLETQAFPDAVHHPNFPSTILRPGQTYRQTTIFRCTTDRRGN